jgi:proline iminopeptidase
LQKRLFTVNQATLWLSDQGEGLPVLLVSGGPGCCDYLAPVEALIANRARTLRFDARGCGRSSLTPPYDLKTVIADLEALRQQLQIQQWVVLGHSWGGDLALAYALQHSIATRAVIQLCGTGLQNDLDWKMAYRQGRDAGLDQLPEMAFPPNLAVNQAGNDSWKQFIKQPLLWKQVAMLSVPVLAIAGSQDIRPSWSVEQVTHLLPNGRYHCIEGAGHCPWLTHAPQLKLLLQDFLDSLL